MTFRVFIILFLITFSVVKGQRTSKFSLKPTLGISASQVHGDNYSGYNKLGFVGGLYVNAALKEKTSLELGIIFVQKGARRNQNPEKFDYRFYYLNLNYVEVPLLLRWQPNKFFFTVGGSFAYLINYYESSEIGNLTGMYPFRSTEYSLNLGIGMMIRPKIGVEVRTNNSIVTIRPFTGFGVPYYNNPVARYFNKGSYNNVLQIAFTYKITSKKERQPSEPKEEI
ncbi:MAG: PorT family protein [Bacteroidia bacterium]|nr:PorT family protein [Bacteroidia bacterium]